MRGSFMRAAGLCLIGIAGAGVLAAQGAIEEGEAAVVATPPSGPTDFGTAGLTAYPMSAVEFSTFSQSDTWVAVAGSPNRYLTSGYFEGGVHLPTGASIEVMELEACDTSGSASVTATLIRANVPAGGGAALATVSTGTADTPGCALFGKTLDTPLTVDNRNSRYFIQVQTGNTVATYVGGVRLFYRLQVTPAPAVATFGDVPTSSPQFQFVEAIAASGITAGCGGGNFCPNNPVTRGQMAVFLAKALGLYWPN